MGLFIIDVLKDLLNECNPLMKHVLVIYQVKKCPLVKCAALLVVN